MLNKYPTTMIPKIQIPMNRNKSFGLTAFFNIINDGRLSVVTAIIKDRTVPSWAPFDNRASAIGILPKISAYIGTPTIVAKTTPNGFLLPKIFSTQV